MRPTSECCLRVDADAESTRLQMMSPRARLPRGVRAFTLLEMLVVLSLMALAVGIAAPRAVGWLDAARERGWRDDFRAYIEALPVRCFLAGESRQFDAQTLLNSVPDAPSRLELRLPHPVSYSALGVASGGEIELRWGDRRETWQIESLTGRVREVR